MMSGEMQLCIKSLRMLLRVGETRPSYRCKHTESFLIKNVHYFCFKTFAINIGFKML